MRSAECADCYGEGEVHAAFCVDPARHHARPECDCGGYRWRKCLDCGGNGFVMTEEEEVA